MRSLAVAALLAASSAVAQEALPPPPPPPSADDVLVPPLPPGRPLPADAPAFRPPAVPGTIGEGPIAPAGSQAAPLHPDRSPWRTSLATGVAGRFGGMQLDPSRVNSGVLLYFGAQADGLWSEGMGRAARLRLRLFTGGETQVYVPSDGEIEGAFMIGRREFRFVVGRLEVGRYPALGLQTIFQFATLPCFEGSIPLAGDTMRLYFYASPVEAAFVRYYGDAHIDTTSTWSSESRAPVAATAGRLRWTTLLPPAVMLSLQGDVVKLWNKADTMVGAEASLGYQVLERTVVFNVAARWDSYRRRGPTPDSSVTESEMKLLGIATLVF
jgi:hypothetical protein